MLKNVSVTYKLQAKIIIKKETCGKALILTKIFEKDIKEVVNLCEVICRCSISGNLVYLTKSLSISGQNTKECNLASKSRMEIQNGKTPLRVIWPISFETLLNSALDQVTQGFVQSCIARFPLMPSRLGLPWTFLWLYEKSSFLSIFILSPCHKKRPGR